MWTRRAFLRAGTTTLFGGLAVGGYTWRIEPHWVRFHRRFLPLPGLPADLEGATLVQLSDLHVGRRVDPEYLTDVLHRVRRLEPDFVVFTGDFVSWSDATRTRDLAEVLEHFPAGRRATLGVLGNHDYGRGWSQSTVADAIEGLARRAGIEILRNAATEVEGLHFVGLDDLWGTRFDPAAALGDWSPRRPSIALCHNPDAVDRPGWSRFRGWILSGHTHGGQCKPPFLPAPILPVENPAYAAGEVRLAGGRRMYINRGIGHLLRVRFNVRPEVTVFSLERQRDL